MIRLLLAVCIVSLLGMFTIKPTHGDSLRCANKIVKTGDNKEMVRRHCGKPAIKQSGYETIYRNGYQIRTQVERWYYDGRSGRLNKTAIFHNGLLVKIVNGERV